MSTLSGGPNIITDGLVLYLDAANRQSYVSGSTTWNDVSRGGNNGTLVNGPTFSTSSGGSIVFDGVDDYMNIISSSYSLVTSSILITISHSLENYYLSYWDRPNSRGAAYNSVVPTGIVQVGITHNGSNYFFHINENTYQADILGIYAYDSVTPPSVGLFGRSRSDSGTSDNVYNHNFSLVPTSSRSTSAPTATTFFENFTTSSLGFFNFTQCIVGKLPAVSRPRNFTGLIYNIKIYNRALTAQEVLQNYNTTKTRYGL